MATAARPPTPEFARPGANPTLETMEYVRAILRTSEQPVSRNQVQRVLYAWGHSTTRQTLNAAIAFLGADGNIADGSKGLIWVTGAGPELARAIQLGQRL